jgi:cupin 2 domain-containing protein
MKRISAPTTNVFADLPAGAGAEQFVELLSRPGLRIERIVSSGQASPPGFWYDQPQAEWVLVLQGEAMLAFDDEPELRRLQAGDFLDIAPHRRHRVEATAVPTVWLAVHYDRRESPRDD